MCPTIDAVPREEYKRLELELAAAKAYMRYMAAEMKNPCRYCKHLTQTGECGQACRKEDHSAFEWKGLPEWIFSGEKVEKNREERYGADTDSVD